MGTLTAYVASPVFSLDGTENAELARNALRFVVNDDILGLSWCEATFVNWGSRDGRPNYLYLARDVLDFGKRLTVQLGPDVDRHQVFDGHISAITAEYPADATAQVLISAEDGLASLRLTRRTRTFTDTTVSELARQLASEHGLTAQVDFTGVRRPVVAQLNQSDLALLRGVARSEGAEVWLSGTELHLGRRPDRAPVADPLRLDYRTNLLSFRVRADLAHQVSELVVTGWSRSDKAAIVESVAASALGSELGSLTSGSSILANAFSDRSERVVRSDPITASQARALAEAGYLERARGFVRASARTGGTPAANVGRRVTVTGVGEMFGGDYTIVGLQHSYDVATGFETHLELERPGIGSAG